MLAILVYRHVTRHTRTTKSFGLFLFDVINGFFLFIMTDYFGFNDSRGNVSGLNNKNTSQKHGLYSTFRCDKPYRLALYWQPSIKRRRLDASAASKSTIEKSNESLTITHNISLDKSVNHETEVAKPTRKKNNTKINNKENEGRNKKTRTTSKKKDATLFEIENTPAVEIRVSIFNYLNTHLVSCDVKNMTDDSKFNFLRPGAIIFF